MSLFGECVYQNLGIHPATQMQAAFFVPTPPTDDDLLLFSSSSSFSPREHVELALWLGDLAVLSLGSAVVAGEKLRSAVSLSSRARDSYFFRACPLSASNDHLNGHSLMKPDVSDDQAPTGRSEDAQTRAVDIASGQVADLGEVWRRPPRQPHQVLARGLQSVEDHILSREDGWKGCAPMKGFLRRTGGKLDNA